MENLKISDIKTELKKIKRTQFGISIPELRKLAQKIAKTDYKKFLDHDDYENFELKLLHAFVIGYAKDDINVLLAYFQKFIPMVNCWEICDSLCQNFKISRKYPDVVWNFLMRYEKTEKEFESRIISVMLLSHFLNDDYIDKVIAVLDKLKTIDYYAQMGVAWALATIMGKYPKKCLDYLKSENCNLDSLTYKKSLQKIRESLKISGEIKKQIKFLKKHK